VSFGMNNMKRQRGRNNGGGGGRNNKPHMPARAQTFDSSGPEVRIRGNAYQVLEKYLALARDATAAGDRISAENYYQHAEHYYRVINANSDGQRPQHPHQQGGQQPPQQNNMQQPHQQNAQPQQPHQQNAQPQQFDLTQQDPGAAPQPLTGDVPPR
jgi:hypothetical protein